MWMIIFASQFYFIFKYYLLFVKSLYQTDSNIWNAKYLDKDISIKSDALPLSNKRTMCGLDILLGHIVISITFQWIVQT